MTAARKIGFAATVTALAIAVAVAVVRAPTGVERRACGHIWPFHEKISLVRATHCCSSGELVNDLRRFELAQEIHKAVHGQFALTTEQLSEELSRPPRHPYFLKSNGTNWTVTVPPGGGIAGAYLLVDSGDIYFHESRIPTTNDLNLRPDLRRKR